MVERTLGDEIVILVEDCISKLPANIQGTVKKIYSNGFVDITTNDGEFQYIECIGSANINSKGIITFVNNDNASPVFICESTGGGGDLSEYVKKSDVKLKIDLEDNGTIVFGLDIGDGF